MSTEDFLTWANSLSPDVQVSCLDLADPTQHQCSSRITFFTDEIVARPNQCRAFVEASAGIADRKMFARKCKVAQVDRASADEFIERHHVQGKNKLGIVAFGLFAGDELIGVLSLGRHHRMTGNFVVLDRLCFARGVRVAGGTGRMLAAAIHWATDKKYERIVSYSDSRLTEGKVYAAVGFTLDREYQPDYQYVSKEGHRLSKQSQKKKATDCPEHFTELQWSTQRSLRRIWDCGKKRWSIALDVPPDQLRLMKSERCAKQHSSGVFKHSHIRGYFQSAKNGGEVYFSSSYELRCMFLLESDQSVTSYRRADAAQINGRWRNPDLLVVVNGREILFEIKPKRRLAEEEVIDQIADTEQHCNAVGCGFKVWTEDDSGFNDEKGIVRWAKEYLTELTGDSSHIERRKELDRQKAKRFYHRRIKGDRINVDCQFCNAQHNVLRLSYDQNLAKNGRFICIRENGHIVGKRPKSVEVPTKAKCCVCKDTKPIEQFTKDKSRKHGYSSKCVECNRKQCMERYERRKNKSK